MRPTGPTNPYLKSLVQKLREVSLREKAKIWKRVAELLSKPRRKKVEVNLSRIERYAKPGEVIVVPGIVLASGSLSKPLTIAAWRFSARAKSKIEESKGKALQIEQLLQENPKGSGIKIMV